MRKRARSCRIDRTSA